MSLPDEKLDEMVMRAQLMVHELIDQVPEDMKDRNAQAILASILMCEGAALLQSLDMPDDAIRAALNTALEGDDIDLYVPCECDSACTNEKTKLN